MKHCCILLTGLVLVLGVGCSGNSDNVQTPEERYASNTKKIVLEFVQRAKQSRKDIGTEISGLLEELEVFESQPVGEHKEVYAKLLGAGQKIKSAAKSRDWRTVESMLNEMTTLANQLPGDVKVDIREAGGEES